MKKVMSFIAVAFLIAGIGCGYGIGHRMYDARLAEYEARINSLLDTTITQHYEWEYKDKTWQWDFYIPLSAYIKYANQPRVVSASFYVEMVWQSENEPFIEEIIQRINRVVEEEGFSEREEVEFVVSFVQGLPYTNDLETTTYDDYPRYPIETLFDRGGDCEDSSIFVATLLDRMGYDVALLVVESVKHMAVGIAIPLSCGAYYEVNGKKYFYVETTRPNQPLGMCNLDVEDKSAWVYPIRS